MKEANANKESKWVITDVTNPEVKKNYNQAERDYKIQSAMIEGLKNQGLISESECQKAIELLRKEYKENRIKETSK